jgi:predicted enzyme related to lactoylglutathione lyase
VEILGVDNVLVPVGELGAAKDFYVAGLGLAVEFEVAARGLVLFSVGAEAPGVMARVDPDAGRGGSPAMRLWLEVPDARAAAEELAERGIQPLADPFEVGTGWAVEVADPWGNIIGLTDYLARPELARHSADG